MVYTHKQLLLIMLLLVATACGSSHTVGGSAVVDIKSGEYTIRVENPVIEFCERMHPEALYPDEIDRETRIIECMKLCSTSNACNIIIPDIPVN